MEVRNVCLMAHLVNVEALAEHILLFEAHRNVLHNWL